jgi:catechol 2,3-dioxygenase-like lactoylglutathione lyase family enzyme
MKTVATSVVLLALLLSSPGTAQTTAPAPRVARPFLVSLGVPDLESAAAWYHGKVGFTLRSTRAFPDRGTRVALLELDGFWLELFQKKQPISHQYIQQRLPEIRDWDEVLGLGKVAFAVADVDALAAKLKAENVRFVTGIQDDDPVFGRSFIVLDNNGNWVQFCQVKPAAPAR